MLALLQADRNSPCQRCFAQRVTDHRNSLVRLSQQRSTLSAAGALQSQGEAAAAGAPGAESSAERAELARLEAQASQLQGYGLDTLNHEELLTLIELQAQARDSPCCHTSTCCARSHTSITLLPAVGCHAMLMCAERVAVTMLLVQMIHI